ncbi:MAG: hypothetical protein VKO00_11635 [Cyanobacteriota bacterium]|nr:hypothetical protein [Cyanobacteriota bacterium]
MPLFPARARIELRELRRPAANRLEALVLAGGRRQVIWLESDGLPLQACADAFLPILLPAAMASGQPLRIEAPLTAEVVAASRRVSNVMASWYPHWAELVLETPDTSARSISIPESAACAAFFSGGLDSFHTLLFFRNQLQHLLFVHGFDIPLAEQSKADLVQRSLLCVAAEAGVSLLTLRTNLRAFTDRWVSWDLHQCGCALAAVALLLKPHLNQVVIPSSYSLPFLHPYGSHPGLETLWSTPGLELLHDALVEDRAAKAMAIAPWSLARRNLRVCWQLNNPELNCGRCRKCLSTYAILRGYCSAYDWPTFPKQLDLKALSQLRANSSDMRNRFLALRDHLIKTGRDPELLAALHQLVEAKGRRHPAKLLRHLAVRGHAWLRA